MGTNNDTPIKTRKRLVILISVFLILFLAGFIRLFYLVIYHENDYGEEGSALNSVSKVVKGTRGDILDRNGKVLATSSKKYNVFLRVNGVFKNKDDLDIFNKKKKKYINKTIDYLKNELNIDATALKKEIKNTKEYRVLVKENIDYYLKDALTSISGKTNKEKDVNYSMKSFIEIDEVEKRYYEGGTLLSNVIGLTNIDGKGIEGIELQYDNYLKSINGKKVSGGNDFPEKNGDDVYLTIDSKLEKEIETIVKNTYSKFQAKEVNEITMDVKSGEIISMCSYPTFDSNNPGVPTGEISKKEWEKLSKNKKTEFILNLRRNKSVVNLYDPGSIFKLVTVASALEEGAIKLSDTFYCKGIEKVYDRKIKCFVYPKSHGHLNVTNAVVNSCNVSMMKIMLKMGYKKFYKYIKLFGIDDISGVDFPGEALPIEKSEEYLLSHPVDLATMSFGQGFQISPLKLLTVISAITNDGKLMVPKLVKQIKSKNNTVLYSAKEEIVRQAISKKTSDEMKKIMLSVFDKNVTTAKVKGYKVGGKTATVQLVNIKTGEYYKNRVIEAMVSVAPIDNPKYITYFQIVDPSPSKKVSTPKDVGPIISEIMSKVLKLDKK